MRAVNPPTLQIRNAEREAKSRIDQLERQTKEAEVELERNISEKRDHFERRRSEESLEQEQSIEKQRAKGYEEIRRLQRAQQEEVNRLKREGESEIARLQHYYKSTINNTDKAGEETLNETRTRFNRAINHEQQSTKGQFEFEKNENALRIKQLKEEQDASLNALQKSGLEHYKNTKESTVEAMHQTEDHFQKNYLNTLKDQQEVIADLQNRATDALHSLRYDTATKLAAYASRQKDPFYKLVRLDADLDETRDAYLLSIRVPAHEQENINVTVRGNEIVVSGQRRNEEKLSPSTGHTVSTSSYQSFSESFPITQAVEGKLLTRQYDGSELIVQVPKKTVDLAYKPRESSRPDRLSVPSKPDFPKNLSENISLTQAKRKSKNTLL